MNDRTILRDLAKRVADVAARKIEWQLRRRLYYHDHLPDDTVIERDWVVSKVIRVPPVTPKTGDLL